MQRESSGAVQRSEAAAMEAPHRNVFFPGARGYVNSQSVVDLACGEGHFTRRLRASGADPVLGVDSSTRMIELAAAEEQERPCGVTYSCQYEYLGYPTRKLCEILGALLQTAQNTFKNSAVAAVQRSCRRR